MIRRPPRSTPFPTRRSSDLTCVTLTLDEPITLSASAVIATVPSFTARTSPAVSTLATCGSALDQVNFRFGTATSVASRSEEHTSELQSQSNLVCRLLLEKTN